MPRQTEPSANKALGNLLQAMSAAFAHGPAEE